MLRIEDGLCVPGEFIDEGDHSDFETLVFMVCGECYEEMHERSAHDIAAYAAAQEAKKKKH